MTEIRLVSQLSREDRVRSLREQALRTTPEITSEVAQITTQVYKENEDEPIIIKRAKRLEQIVLNKSIFIEKNQLIVGCQGPKLRVGLIFPEYSCDWVLEELEQFDKRSSDKFLVSEDTKRELRGILQYWVGKTVKDRAYASLPEATRRAVELNVIHWEGQITSGIGHVIVDFEKVLRCGFEGILKDAEQALANLDLAEPGSIERYQFLRAVCIVLRAATSFIRRYAKLTKELAVKENNRLRKEELETISEMCDWISTNPPRTFWEALQLVWFVELILHLESSGHSISVGRVDQYLYPFYSGDIKRGKISKERALELIECFLVKFYSSLNKVRTWGHTLYDAGYPIFLNLCIGGQTPDGRDATNELSYLFLEAESNVRLPEPNFYVRIHERCPEEFLLKCCEVIRMGFGAPALLNDNVVVPSLLNKGVDLEDALNYSAAGCPEVSVPGKFGYRTSGMTKLNLLKVLELALNNGVDPRTGVQLCPGNGDLSTFKTFDDVMDAWKKQLEFYSDQAVIADHVMDYVHEELAPDPFCSALVQDCIERGKSINGGGAVYDIQAGVQFGVPNVGDSLAAIRKLVFEEKAITGKELKEALDSNFEGIRGQEIRRLLLKAPKYGEDEDYPDLITKEAYDCFLNMLPKYKTYRYGRGPRGCIHGGCTTTLSSNVPFGKDVGATPDGRKAREPLADGVSPVHNSGRKGPTAVMKSVTKLSTLLISPGGNLLNVRIMPYDLKDEAGLRKLAALIRGLFELNGWHVQFNAVSSETLRDAQKHPERHLDLIVRVAGYCAQFIALDPDVQEDIIERLEHHL